MNKPNLSNGTSVIIVLRHGCDGGSQPSNQTLDFNPNCTVTFYGSKGTVTDNKVSVVQNWLGCLGLKQMHGLQNNVQMLNSVIVSTQRIYRIYVLKINLQLINRLCSSYSN